MQIARVIGDVVTTIKDENLSGIKLLVLQPLDPDGNACRPHAGRCRRSGRGRRRDGVLRQRKGSELPVSSD